LTSRGDPGKRPWPREDRSARVDAGPLASENELVSLVTQTLDAFSVGGGRRYRCRALRG